MKAKAAAVILIGSAYIGLWGFLTGGWTHSLWIHGRIAMFFAVISGMEALYLTAQGRKITRLREMCSPEYERSLQQRESVCDEVEEENRQLQRDLAAAQGKADMNEFYLEKFKEKSNRSDSAVVNEANKRFTSPDGMSREDKDKMAYRLHKDGWNNDEIAAELHLSTGGIKSYISRGKRFFEKYPYLLDNDKDGNQQEAANA